MYMVTYVVYNIIQFTAMSFGHLLITLIISFVIRVICNSGFSILLTKSFLLGPWGENEEWTEKFRRVITERLGIATGG